MKLHCSELNHGLLMNNISCTNNCVCGEVETAFHYLSNANNTQFKNQMCQETGFVQKLSLDIILNGD